MYDHWLALARDDDFVGVQNYEREIYGPDGALPVPEGVPVNGMGTAVEPDSLRGAVEYAYAVSRVPILVSEHGIGTEDDSLRAGFLEPSLDGLAQAIADGIPVLGYCHWTLMDNFEWIGGYGPKLGLHSVDRETFERTAQAERRRVRRPGATRSWTLTRSTSPRLRSTWRRRRHAAVTA